MSTPLTHYAKRNSSSLKTIIYIFITFFIHSHLNALNHIETLISKGSGLNNFFLYEEALNYLNEAISLDPCSDEAYKERAFSYFELNRIDLALDDYYHVKKKKPSYKKHNTFSFSPILNYSLTSYSSNSKNATFRLDFAQGLLQGSLIGGREGTVEFISSVRGGLTFLWSLACSPVDVPVELIEALYQFGELIADGNISYLLEAVVPEIFECKRYWHSWSNYTKGQKLGFIVGKYSVLVFYEITSFKGGAVLYNRLKRANIMAILERYSVTRSARILEESAHHAHRSAATLRKVFAGSIIPHNPNVLPHIFTKKHRWDKFISITGDHRKDFEKLTEFLESHDILRCPRELSYDYGGILTYKYTKEIGGDKIVALFEVNKDKIPLLRNAWVEVGAPFAP